MEMQEVCQLLGAALGIQHAYPQAAVIIAIPEKTWLLDHEDLRNGNDFFTEHSSPAECQRQQLCQNEPCLEEEVIRTGTSLQG